MIRATTLVIEGTHRFYDKREVVKDIYDRFSGKVPALCRKKLHFLSSASIQIPLIEGSPELNEVLNLCEEHGLSVCSFSGAYYTKKELEQCEFFQLILPCPTELDGVYLRDFGNIPEGTCPVCGFGGELRGDVCIERKYPQKHKIGIIPPAMYMAEEIKALVEENELTGLSFDQKMVDYKGREMTDFYVPRFTSVLPPMSKSAWLELESPKSCGHGTLYLRSDIQYEREKLSQAKDFNLTQEYVNNFNMREIIVSARARKVLQQNKIFCRFIPVLLI